MRILFMLALVLCSASVASAWPFPPLPQCGEAPTCDVGCLVPVNEKCAAVAADAVNNSDAVVCSVGSALGICAPVP